MSNFIIFNNNIHTKVSALDINGKTIYNLDTIEKITYYPPDKLWIIEFNNGSNIFATGNVFVNTEKL